MSSEVAGINCGDKHQGTPALMDAVVERSRIKILFVESRPDLGPGIRRSL